MCLSSEREGANEKSLLSVRATFLRDQVQRQGGNRHWWFQECLLVHKKGGWVIAAKADIFTQANQPPVNCGSQAQLG